MIVRITRVKVGNRQAPLQHQKPHPRKVGFLRLRRWKNARGTNGKTALTPCPSAARSRPSERAPTDVAHPSRGETTRQQGRRTNHRRQPPGAILFVLREKPLSQPYPVRRADRHQLVVEVVARVVQHARADAVAAFAVRAVAVASESSSRAFRADEESPPRPWSARTRRRSRRRPSRSSPSPQTRSSRVLIVGG